ncbi:DUF5107 domain-containing protein [Streptomyces sp. H27-D2]|uniref:DUF5107 domain-containing protein n=1 Tax=Streptomyces sp. H27-D2 TaxID=3046304 RepID=UPI002DB9509E|nr:DUF5107 domain-containing protein [Streptomyces sp. H27-D2]MEC4016958.1 DUF5107 domain-containing protein [Streptomyces sp. H27-D2]
MSEDTVATSVRRTTLTLPAAQIGPDNPLPALCPLDETHSIDDRARAGLPSAMARQIGYEPLRSVLPVRLRDGYRRERTPTDLDAIVIENDRLRATVLPGLGGRVHSLLHKPTGRELLYRNPVLQPAAFALNGAWFSGGIEWNIGATGHTTLSCAPMHAARVPAPDGGEMLRLWEWERLRDLPFQVDLWLPDGSDFLYVGVRVRNPHDRTVPVYWWSNIAVPEGERTRVLAPADAAWHYGYERSLRRVPVPESDGVDRSYPLRGDFPADYFYDVPDGERRWIASLDEDGQGLVQTSTDLLRGRKLFLWGSGAGGRRWQEWLTEPGTGGYAEIQAGLARTQLEHVPLAAGEEFAWLEAYGPLAADPAAVHGDDWTAACAEAAGRLETALPRAGLDAVYAAWRPYADAEPKESLATGSGWGALEVERGGYELPGTPFEAATLGAEQQPWLNLLHTGALPATPPPAGPSLVGPHWRDLLEAAPSDVQGGGDGDVDYHLGVAQWHAGDRAQAVRSWERSLRVGPTPWALRCLAVAETEAGETSRAADRYLEALGCPAGTGPGTESGAGGEGAGDGRGEQTGDGGAVGGAWELLRIALAREAVPALLADGRTEDAAAVLARLRPDVRERGRFQLLHAQVLLAQGDAASARAVFDRGFEVDDLREGDESLDATWHAIAERLTAGDGPLTEDVRARARAEHPLPARYEYRIRPAIGRQS